MSQIIKEIEVLPRVHINRSIPYCDNSMRKIRKYIAGGIAFKLMNNRYGLRLFKVEPLQRYYKYKIHLGKECLMHTPQYWKYNSESYFIGIEVISGEAININLICSNGTKFEGSSFSSLPFGSYDDLDSAINSSFEHIKNLINVFLDHLIQNITLMKTDIMQVLGVPMLAAAPILAASSNNSKSTKRKEAPDTDEGSACKVLRKE